MKNIIKNLVLALLLVAYVVIPSNANANAALMQHLETSPTGPDHRLSSLTVHLLNKVLSRLC